VTGAAGTGVRAANQAASSAGGSGRATRRPWTSSAPPGPRLPVASRRRRPRPARRRRRATQGPQVLPFRSSPGKHPHLGSIRTD